MKKYLLSFLLLAASSLPAFAAQDDDMKYMTFLFASGDEVSFTLQDFRITFSSDSLYITSADTKASMGLDVVKKMYFSTAATGIADISSYKLSLSQSRGCIVISSAMEGSVRASLYSASTGMRVRTVEISRGSNTIDTSSLPAGIYILSVSGKAVKILKK